MIDWIKCIKAIEPNFDNEGWGGAKSYEDEDFGGVDFLYMGNTSQLTITWFPYSLICLCGHGVGDVNCDCEWNWFLESIPIEKKFTKNQALSLNQKDLFG